MEIDRDMTIFLIAFALFFIAPVTIILTAIVADWRTRTNDHDHLTK